MELKNESTIVINDMLNVLEHLDIASADKQKKWWVAYNMSTAKWELI